MESCAFQPSAKPELGAPTPPPPCGTALPSELENQVPVVGLAAATTNLGSWDIKDGESHCLPQWVSQGEWGVGLAPAGQERRDPEWLQASLNPSRKSTCQASPWICGFSKMSS